MFYPPLPNPTAVKLKFLFTEAPELFLNCTLNDEAVMSDRVKKSPACRSLAVIPIDGSCVFAPNKELVPTKNGESKAK